MLSVMEIHMERFKDPAGQKRCKNESLKTCRDKKTFASFAYHTMTQPARLDARFTCAVEPLRRSSAKPSPYMIIGGT